MKRIFTLLTALSLSAVTFSQTVSPTNTTTTNIAIGGRSWSTVSPFTAGTLSNGQPFTDYLFFSGFDFSSLPANIVVNSMTVSFARSTNGAVEDSAVRFVLAGQVNYAANSNAASTPTTWPATSTSNTYTFNPSSLGALTTADLQNPGFGIAIAARRTAGGGINVFVTGTVTLTVNYSILAPLILTDFSVAKNADNHVDIRFSTATEENVQSIYVERSTDGRNFEKLFTIAPKGARNVYTSYFVTDKAPATGSNYYRISEVDKNGRWFYYMTKLVNITRKTAAFNAYYNGGEVVANISSIPGQYNVSLIDMSGITISNKSINVNSGTAQVTMNAPARSGVYVVVIKGQGISESTRVAITR